MLNLLISIKKLLLIYVCIPRSTQVLFTKNTHKKYTDGWRRGMACECQFGIKTKLIFFSEEKKKENSWNYLKKKSKSLFKYILKVNWKRFFLTNPPSMPKIVKKKIPRFFQVFEGHIVKGAFNIYRISRGQSYVINWGAKLHLNQSQCSS